MSWFPLAAPQMIKRHPRRLKTLWMSSPPLDLHPPVFQEIHPFLDAIGHICPFFFSSAHSKGESRNAHRHLTQKTSGNRCGQVIPPLVLEFFFPLILFGGPQEFVLDSPHSPFLPFFKQ